jgi:hypothetical protein
MKKPRQHGTPIYGDRYTDSNGVTLYWSPNLRRYVTVPEDEPKPPPTAEPPSKVTGGETVSFPSDDETISPPNAVEPSEDSSQMHPDARGRDVDPQVEAECLYQALDSLVRLLVVRGVDLSDVPLGVETFDAALKADPDHQAARARFRKVWESIFLLLPDDKARIRLMGLDSAVNALVVSAANIVWKLGLATARTTPPKNVS